MKNKRIVLFGVIAGVVLLGIAGLAVANRAKNDTTQQKLLAAENSCKNGNHHGAVQIYRKLAEQGNAKAQYELGSHLFEGSGVGKNMAEAVYWFHKAAEQDDVKSQSHLGGFYLMGLGVAPNEAEAAKW